MKETAKLTIKKVPHYSTIGYAFVSLDSCCDEFSKAFKKNIIFFGERISGFDCLSFEYGINIGHINNYPWGEFKEISKHRIKYCPFCGQEIEIIEDTSKLDDDENVLEQGDNSEELCKWCYSVLGKQCVTSNGRHYCSVGCWKSDIDHKRLADLEAWKARMEGNICDGCLENVP